MSYDFSNSVWVIQGEKSFDGVTNILNPEIRIQSVLINSISIILNLKITENQGVYEHAYSLSANIGSETNINLAVYNAISEAIPEATLQQ